MTLNSKKFCGSYEKGFSVRQSKVIIGSENLSLTKPVGVIDAIFKTGGSARGLLLVLGFTAGNIATFIVKSEVVLVPMI